MAISNERSREFARLGREQMLEWLLAAVEEFYREGRGPAAFAPFELFFPPAESDAQALALGIAALPVRARATFKSAVAGLVRVLSIGDQQVWTFVAELVWRIESPAAVDEFELRFNDAFIAEMIAAAPKQFDVIVAFLRNSTVSNSKSLVRLLRRIVSSAHFNDSQTTLTLVRLCEIDPGGWTEHMAATRDTLHTQWTRIHKTKGLEAMRAAQDKLALQIYRAIGFDRLHKDIGRLTVITDAPGWKPSDNWFWRALFERVRALVPLSDGRIAAADRLNDPRKISGKSARYVRPATGGKGPPTPEEALGENSISVDDDSYSDEALESSGA